MPQCNPCSSVNNGCYNASTSVTNKLGDMRANYLDPRFERLSRYIASFDGSSLFIRGFVTSTSTLILPAIGSGIDTLRSYFQVIPGNDDSTQAYVTESGISNIIGTLGALCWVTLAVKGVCMAHVAKLDRLKNEQQWEQEYLNSPKPSWEAIRHVSSSVELIRKMKSMGADLHKSTEDGYTILQSALSHNRVEIINEIFKLQPLDAYTSIKQILDNLYFIDKEMEEDFLRKTSHIDVASLSYEQQRDLWWIAGEDLQRIAFLKKRGLDINVLSEKDKAGLINKMAEQSLEIVFDQLASRKNGLRAVVSEGGKNVIDLFNQRLQSKTQSSK